jgi:hypothetical protein
LDVPTNFGFTEYGFINADEVSKQDNWVQRWQKTPRINFAYEVGFGFKTASIKKEQKGVFKKPLFLSDHVT